MSKHRGKDRDPFHDIREWQDHRYDPGYFTGGRIHPLYRASRPNRAGYVLLVFGGVSVAMLAIMVARGEEALVGILTVGAFAALQIAAGLRLIRGPRHRE
jgi:hypothetical protein